MHSGASGYPIAKTPFVAMQEIRRTLTVDALLTVTVVCFDAAVLRAHEAARV